MAGRILLGPAAVLCLSLALATAAAGAGSAGAELLSAPSAADPPPVASLEPRETERLWRRLVERRSRQARPQQADCRPLRAVFYAATDFLRLATKLAATPSPCAEYYVSVPPLVADKTQPRPNAAPRIRALGRNFHALAEIHLATWTRWVASTGSSWHTAGVTARQRMAAAGYDVSQGDSWVLNEMTTAVRRGTGNARTNIREFLRGLYEGDGTRPTRGAVFVIGFGQRTSDLSLYQTNLQNWLADSAFWTDMATYVSDWSQEVYGDVRSWAVPGAPNSVRRDYLNDYLQHKLVLTNAGPPAIAAAQAFLRAAHSSLGNAAWERETAYGWTLVPAEQMAAYVSAQVHAIRYFGATSGLPQDRGGVAWAPRNTTGMSGADFAARTGLILDRLAAAVRDSARSPDPADPGSAACGPPGQPTLCAADVAGASLSEGWKSFRTWTQPALTFTTPAQTIPAGTPSAAIAVGLSTTSGTPATSTVPLAVTVSSSSPTGTFSTSPAGPWSSTLALTIPAGASTAGSFYYLDTQAGSHVLTASAAGVTSGTQPITVTPGPVATLVVTPASATIRARGARRLSAIARDAHGNPVPAPVTWSVAPVSLGTLAVVSGGDAVLTAGRWVGRGAVVATVTTDAGLVSARATLNVTPARLRIASIRYASRARWLLVSLLAVDEARKSVPQAAAILRIERDGRRYATKRTVTGAAGRVTFRIRARSRGCFTTTVRRVAARGFAWDGRTPRNRFCRRG